MSKGIQWIATATLLSVLLIAIGGTASAQGQRGDGDPFKGKLFPPNVILEHREALGLTREQFTAIRQAVVEVQANVAEHEWDLAAAYQEVLAELDRSPIDDQRVLELVGQALAAENEVKKLQVGMLLKLRTLLTDEQMETLRELNGY